jgi:hypothetical protein
MRQAGDSLLRNDASDDRLQLRTTIDHLVRQQDEHLEWLRRIEEKLRATRDSMLVFQPDAER